PTVNTLPTSAIACLPNNGVPKSEFPTPSTVLIAQALRRVTRRPTAGSRPNLVFVAAVCDRRTALIDRRSRELAYYPHGPGPDSLKLGWTGRARISGGLAAGSMGAARGRRRLSRDGGTRGRVERQCFEVAGLLSQLSQQLVCPRQIGVRLVEFECDSTEPVLDKENSQQQDCPGDQQVRIGKFHEVRHVPPQANETGWLVAPRFELSK